MANIVFNIAKGRVVEYYNRVKSNDPANSALILVPIETSGLEADSTLIDVDTLAALSERGHVAGVLPYYLHQLDRVAGAAHFEVDDARALALHAALVARLPGYLVPKLVREVAGDPAKRPLLPETPFPHG